MRSNATKEPPPISPVLRNICRVPNQYQYQISRLTWGDCQFFRVKNKINFWVFLQFCFSQLSLVHYLQYEGIYMGYAQLNFKRGCRKLWQKNTADAGEMGRYLCPFALGGQWSTWFEKSTKTDSKNYENLPIIYSKGSLPYLQNLIGWSWFTTHFNQNTQISIVIFSFLNDMMTNRNCPKLIKWVHIFIGNFSFEPGVANEIFENEPKSCLTVA